MGKQCCALFLRSASVILPWARKMAIFGILFDGFFFGVWILDRLGNSRTDFHGPRTRTRNLDIQQDLLINGDGDEIFKGFIPPLFPYRIENLFYHRDKDGLITSDGGYISDQTHTLPFSTPNISERCDSKKPAPNL